jgi:hypothetical protein
VQVTQELESLDHARRAVLGGQSVVEPVPAGDVKVDLLVAAGEGARTQARDERDLVEWVARA